MLYTLLVSEFYTDTVTRTIAVPFSMVQDSQTLVVYFVYTRIKIHSSVSNLVRVNRFTVSTYYLLFIYWQQPATQLDGIRP